MGAFGPAALLEHSIAYDIGSDDDDDDATTTGSNRKQRRRKATNRAGSAGSLRRFLMRLTEGVRATSRATYAQRPYTGPLVGH